MIKTSTYNLKNNRFPTLYDNSQPVCRFEKTAKCIMGVYKSQITKHRPTQSQSISVILSLPWSSERTAAALFCFSISICQSSTSIVNNC